jgi:hypothetical protein
VRLNDALELGILVPAREEQRPVREVGQAAAEDVVAGVHVHRSLDAGGGVPHSRASVVVHREGLGRCIADRVVREHLPVLEQRHVHTHNRPVDQRAPLTHIPLRASDRRFRRLRVRRGGHDGTPRELSLDARSMSHGVLRLMAANGADLTGVSKRRPRNRGEDQDREGEREDDATAP